MLELVKRLEGKSDTERFQILLDEVCRRNWNHIIQHYEYSGQHGSNLIIDLNQGCIESILLVAHFDSFPGSPGANDDASALAVLMDAGDKIAGLQLSKNVRIIFFDDEEPTLHWWKPLGSTKYVEEYGVDSLCAVIDLEMCGIGNAVGIWPVEGIEDRPLLLQISELLRQLNIPFDYGYRIPGFYADYLPFREAGFQDAYCLTVFDWEERDLVRAFAEASRSEVFARFGGWKVFKLPLVPTVFKHYHTSKDRSEFIAEGALEMMSRVVFELVKTLM